MRDIEQNQINRLFALVEQYRERIDLALIRIEGRTGASKKHTLLDEVREILQGPTYVDEPISCPKCGQLSPCSSYGPGCP